MSTLVQDIRLGIRLLRKSPGFTAVAAIALALGIGANTAIFSVVNAVLLRPLPYPAPSRLGVLWQESRGQGWSRMGSSGPNFLEYKERARTLEEVVLFEPGSGTLSGFGEPLQVPGLRTTTNLLSMLGAKPILGRDFAPGEAFDSRVAILSHGAWMRIFGGDPEAIGKRIMVDGLPYTLIGVTPPELWLPVPADAFVPWSDADLRRQSPNDHRFSLLVRLKSGVSFRQASAEVDGIARQIALINPRMAGWGASVEPLQDALVDNVRMGLMTLLVAVALVLLIACTNIANLMLARAASRERESAIRAALGAGRWRLVRQFLTETLVLGSVGGILGLILALWGVDLLEKLVPQTLRITGSNAEVVRPRIVIDATVLAFTALLSLASGLIFGVAPAPAAAGPGVQEALKEGGRHSASSRSRRTRAVLVVAEVALALVLLISAGLTLKSFWKLQQVNPGFLAHGLLVMETELPTDSRYQKSAEQWAFFERVLGHIKTLPGVEAAAISSSLPLGQRDQRVAFRVKDRPLPPSGQLLPADYRSISEEYFTAMRIPLRRGRFFTEHDRAGRPEVAIIDENTARRHWPSSDPIGQKLEIGRSVLEIVGIVGAVRSGGLDHEPADATIYTSYRQRPDPHVTLVVRHPNPASIVLAAKNAVYFVDPGQPVFNVRTMDDVVAGSQSASRFTLVALAIFAAVALALAAAGIYGVISYSVAQRTGEIGIRIALGAGTRDVLRLVVGQGMVLAGAGVAIGLGAALAATRLLSALLYGVSPTDAMIFCATAAVLAAVALAASYLPARRAARIAPVVSLRYE
jgi:putative ABC transport system permease protein